MEEVVLTSHEVSCAWKYRRYIHSSAPFSVAVSPAPVPPIMQRDGDARQASPALASPHTLGRVRAQRRVKHHRATSQLSDRPPRARLPVRPLSPHLARLFLLATRRPPHDPPTHRECDRRSQAPPTTTTTYYIHPQRNLSCGHHTHTHTPKQ